MQNIQWIRFCQRKMSCHSKWENYIHWYTLRYSPSLTLGKLDTLKHFKDDVKEVHSGDQCGMSVAEFENLRVGDLVQCYREVETPRKLR
jgi:translation initiation factor IF-2